MRCPLRPRWGVALALFCSLVGSLPSGTWALCVEADGHVALEIGCQPVNVALPSTPADRAPDGCRECRDYHLTAGGDLGLAGHRQLMHAPLPAAAPACGIEPALAATAIAERPCTPPGAPGSGRQRFVLRI